MSALPDFLASHYSGTLDELESHVRAVEQARSMASAAQYQRTDIELPGALRYLCRLCRAIHSALHIIRGLDPVRFSDTESTLAGFSCALTSPSVLRTLRLLCARFLPQLPTPLGFNPSPIIPASPSMGFQHRTGRDPPEAIVESL